MVKELFGGALVAYIPPEFTDISTIREIPDSQEVFANAAYDQSIIIELLEQQSDCVDGDLDARLHFSQIADDNEATSSEITDIKRVGPEQAPKLPADKVLITMVEGTQHVSKFRETKADAVNVLRVLMAIVRIPHVKTDLVISFNVPIAFGQGSSSAQLASQQLGGVEEALQIFHRFMQSLEIKDWGLFGA